MALLCTIVASCGGGGGTASANVDAGGGSGGDTGGGSPPVDPPAVGSDSDFVALITFPVDGAATDGVDTITVSGSVVSTNNALSAAAVESLLVNGVEAELNIDTGR